MCALYRIPDLDFSAQWDLTSFPDCPGGATGLIKGEACRSFGWRLPRVFSHRESDSDLGLGFWMIDAACEGCGRLESALLLRLCHAGGCSSVWQPLPLWHGHALTGLEHQHAAAAAAVGGGEETSGVGARRPLRTLFGRHGPFAWRIFDGEQRARAPDIMRTASHRQEARLLLAAGQAMAS